MGKTYYDCPCCERRVWVHEFWGAGFVGSVCWACRDDHGSSCSSSCRVDGPRRQRRLQAEVDEAQRKARQDEIDRRAREREKRERDERDRYEREMRKLAQRRAEALRLKREEEEEERRRVEELMKKEIKDKEEAARKIREKIKKVDPYKEFKKFNTTQFVKDIANRALDIAATGEILGEKVDTIKEELKERFKEEFEQIKPEVIRYKRYANAMVNTSKNYIAQFERVFQTSVSNVHDVADLVDDATSADNDEEEKKSYQKKMTEKLDALCTAAIEVSGELAVVEAYYDKMISDAKWFLKLADDYQTQQRTVDDDFKGLANDADNIKSQRLTDFEQNTTVTAEVEYEAYKRDVNGFWGYCTKQVWDKTRTAAAATADGLLLPIHLTDLSEMALYGASGKRLIANSMRMHKKIQNEKYGTKTLEVKVKVEYEYYDGDKHKKNIKTFLSNALEQIKESMDVSVPQLTKEADEVRAKFEQLEGIKAKYVTPMKTQMNAFKQNVEQLRGKLQTLPLQNVKCEMLAGEWEKLAEGMKDIMRNIKVKNQMAKKELENIQ